MKPSLNFLNLNVRRRLKHKENGKIFTLNKPAVHYVRGQRRVRRPIVGRPTRKTCPWLLWSTNERNVQIRVLLIQPGHCTPTEAKPIPNIDGRTNERMDVRSDGGLSLLTNSAPIAIH